MLDGLLDDEVDQYLEEHPKIMPLFEVDVAEFDEPDRESGNCSKRKNHSSGKWPYLKE